jgi:hypothetical protein
MRKLITVFSEKDLEELMAICNSWSSSPEVVDIEVKAADEVVRADEVILVKSNGQIVSPPRLPKIRPGSRR